MVMKKFILLFCLVFSTVFFAQDWQENYTEALAMAKERDKPLILVFAGSDWCGPCIKLDKKIRQSEEFKAFSKENYILYKADFPRKKANRLSETLTAQNTVLAEKYNSQGHFPLVVVLDKNGDVLGNTGYANSTPSAYISHLNTFLK